MTHWYAARFCCRRGLQPARQLGALPDWRYCDYAQLWWRIGDYYYANRRARLYYTTDAVHAAYIIDIGDWEWQTGGGECDYYCVVCDNS